MEHARKHWRSGRCGDSAFRVERWSDEAGGAMIRSIQIGESPPTPYGEGELQADSADAAFGMAQAMVKSQLDEQAQGAAAADDTPSDASE